MINRKTEFLESIRGRAVNAPPAASARADARVVQSKLKAEVELTIDDSDFGTDPYNCTGRFTVLKKD